MQLPPGAEYRRRKPLKGLLIYALVALVVSTVLILFGVYLDDWESYGPLGRILITLAYGLLFWFTMAGIYVGRGIREPSAADVLCNDSRRPVLFLRSFTDDATGHPDQGNYEEILKPVLTRIGPLISIGQPEELVTHGGGARLYARNENWKRIVGQLMDQASAVVIETGMSEGLKWEERRALGKVEPEKILFLIPETRRRSRRGSNQLMRHFLLIDRIQPNVPKPLPITLGDSYFLMFDKNWNAQLLPSVRYWPTDSGLGVKWENTLLPFVLRHSLSGPRWRARAAPCQAKWIQRAWRFLQGREWADRGLAFLQTLVSAIIIFISLSVLHFVPESGSAGGGMVIAGILLVAFFLAKYLTDRIGVLRDELSVIRTGHVRSRSSPRKPRSQ